MTDTYTYTVYGLTLQLPFSCPGLMPAPMNAMPDVVVAYGSVPRELANSLFQKDSQGMGLTWQVAPGCFLFRAGKRAARFLVEEGTKVTVELNPQAEFDRVLHHLLHTVIVAVLHQRGLLVLHGNAAVTARGAVVVTGMSGAGKSTTLAALLDRGCPMMADDITVLRKSANGYVEVLPGVPHVSLCDDTAMNLGIATDDLPRNPLRRAKAVIPISESFSKEAKPLRAIYFIKPSANQSLRIIPVKGAFKFAALQEAIYGPLLPQEHHRIFMLLAAVVTQAEFFQVERPIEKWTVQELTEAILNG